MQQNPSPNKRRGFSTREIKILIATGAVTASLGLWGVFSQQLIDDAASFALSASAPASAAAPAADGISLNLPPLPTLIPYNGIKADPVSAQPATAVNSQPAPQVIAPLTTGKIFLGGAAPQASAPVARTRSSR